MSRRRRLGLRREALILLPVSLLLLVALSTLALFAHRNALALLAEERREDAGRQARALAMQLGPDASGAEAELRRLGSDALGLAVVGEDGEPLLIFDDVPLSNLLEGADSAVDQPIALGPNREVGDRIVAFAPLGGGKTLRLDLRAGLLAGQLRTAKILLVSVTAINAAVLILMLIYLPQLLSPYERMLESARLAGGSEQPELDDEVDFLVQTFERAVTRLSAPSEDEEIAALEKTVATSFASGVLLLDREGRVLALNEVGLELLRIPPRAPGTPLREALEAHPDLVELLEVSIEGDSDTKRAECRAGEISLGLTVHPLRRDDRTLRGHLVLFADLTEAAREAGERRLEESLERLGEVAAGVAHELRNGVATLSGYLSLAARARDGESLTDYVEEMQRETRQLERVVEDFLTFARPGTVRPARVDLAELVRRAASDPTLGEPPVEVDAEPLHVLADAQLLERALRNLLQNASRAQRESGSEGAVAVRVENGASGPTITVVDRGAGVPREIRDRLFHPFVTGRSDGVGLGLAVSRRIATLHGGKLTVEDRESGGTRATLELPADTIATQGNARAR